MEFKWVWVFYYRYFSIAEDLNMNINSINFKQ